MILLTKRIQIVTSAVDKIAAEFIEENPKTGEAIWSALPIEGKANRWGNEIYFSIPVNIGLEKGQEVVSIGDLAYWPPGKAICIFFGPTPVSRGNEPRAYSPVNVFAKIAGDASVFKKVKDGDRIRIERKV